MINAGIKKNTCINLTDSGCPILYVFLQYRMHYFLYIVLYCIVSILHLKIILCLSTCQTEILQEFYLFIFPCFLELSRIVQNLCCANNKIVNNILVHVI